MNLLNSDFIVDLNCFVLASLLLLSVVFSLWGASNDCAPTIDSSGNNSEPGNNNNWWKILLFFLAINLGVAGGVLFERYGEALIPGSNGYLPPSVAIFGGALVHFLIFISQATHETLFIDFTRLLNCGFFQDSSVMFMKSIVALEIGGVANMDEFFSRLCDLSLVEVPFCGDRIVIVDFYKNEVFCLIKQFDVTQWVHFKLIAHVESDILYEPLQEAFYFFFDLYCYEHSLIFTIQEKEFYFYLFVKSIADHNTLMVYNELFG